MEKLIEIFFVGMVINGCGHFGHETLKLPVSIDFYMLYKFNDFRECVIKNGRNLSIHETLKFALSQE